MAEICKTLGIETETVVGAEAEPLDPHGIEQRLGRDPAITHVGAVHCETTTGLLNPLEELGTAVRRQGRTFLVDAMSSFGGVPIDFHASGVDFLISSANKCLQGVPGFAFVLARRDLLELAEGRARSVSLDLHAQWRGLESDGQFRFTPPTHALLAFWQALEELEAEGGIRARAGRFAKNATILTEGMVNLGFEPYLADAHRSNVITSFRYLEHPNFSFREFYERLSARGFVIYPGKLSTCDCFRIGTIGHLFPKDVQALVRAVRSSLKEMGIRSAKAAARSGPL